MKINPVNNKANASTKLYGKSESGALEFLSNRSLPMYLICGH